MSKYIKLFNTVATATEDEDLLSPNVTYIEQDKLLNIDCGDNVDVEISGTTIEDVKIFKRFPRPVNNKQIVYRTTLSTAVEPNANTLLGANSSVLSIVSNEFNEELQCWFMTLSDDLVTVGENAFYKSCGFTYVALPDSVTSLGYRSFRQCSDTWCVFNFGPNIRSISDQAFHGDNLKNFSFPAGVTSCGLAFMYTGWKNNKTHTLLIPGTLTTMGNDSNSMFLGCSGNGCENVIIEEGVEEITAIFWGNAGGDICNILSVQLPSTLKTIGFCTFASCESMTNISELPEGLITIGEYSFYDCSSLTHINIPSTVSVISDASFAYCTSLSDIVINDGVNTIKFASFCGCPITNLILPSTITSLEDYAFGVDEESLDFPHVLETITCKAINPPVITADTFAKQPIQHIYVPASSVDAYKAATNWAAFGDKISAIVE